ncbi:hypothetical protein DOM21_03920 [Bacteriovorax stolpii]|uniref:Uncharacterized protein n=1 Tax=Bacteriovorax stolpii TaxID=960 RepID=A0A2K9NV75_BACTC|nr:methyl-accepting chemotaxis protein [Bacteriovorax stolpii]AUN99407.1 hypothetical protein C0V70_15090 [Bacteriovorax stolpii]QDK40614.1 hypothetical protein DOM21_03920 [Bacteriovorax stolpii]TDP55050.1 methyl-accepting chemotaxis protein [Bacteriovorax stolpii]
MNTVTMSNQTEKDYLKKVNFWMLLLCLAHIPFIAGIAAYFDTGILSALIVGSLIASGPLAMYFIQKDSKVLSILLGIASMSFSALLIHHARGMIEMHFHIFTFIAMLIVFANPWVILAAAATIAVHHVSFYFLFPASVFNYQASFGIVVVHALFVVAETIPAIITARSFSKYIIAQGSIVKQLEELSDDILSSANSAANNSATLSSNSKEQTKALEVTVLAVDEIIQTIQKSSEDAVKSQSVSQSSKTSADIGQDSMLKMISSIKDIENCNAQMNSQFEDFNHQLTEIVDIIGEIGDKTKVINEIVFQTKLLSFNASVEAARAGEHGKGFAVVAEEIGNLATMSGKSSQEINQLLMTSTNKVESIASESKIKIQQISQVTKEKIQSGNLTANECHEALTAITKNIDEAIALMKNIHLSSGQQSKNANEISKAMKNFGDLTSINTQTATYSEDSSQKLKEQAEGIKEVVESLSKAVA